MNEKKVYFINKKFLIILLVIITLIYIVIQLIIPRTPPDNKWTCDDWRKYKSVQEAQTAFNKNPIKYKSLDRNKDNKVCE